MSNNEEIPEGVTVSDENKIIADAAAETSTTNTVSQEDLGDLDKEAADGETQKQEETKETYGAKQGSEKKVHSPKFYKAFSNGALTGIDKLWEGIMTAMVESEITVEGLKKKDPEEFADNVLLLAEQLEMTEKQISELMGWLVVAGVIVGAYVKPTQSLLKENKELKKKKEQVKKAVDNVTKGAEEATIESETISKETELNKRQAEIKEELKPLRKRGNWRYHTQPCACENCKDFRDSNGNILDEYKIVK